MDKYTIETEINKSRLEHWLGRTVTDYEFETVVMFIKNDLVDVVDSLVCKEYANDRMIQSVIDHREEYGDPNE